MSGAKLPSASDRAAWPAPNYENPTTRRHLVLGVEIPLMVAVIIFASMRFYTRTVIISALGFDDLFMAAAAVTSVATNMMTCISTLPKYQTGYHIWDLRPELAGNLAKTTQMALATQLLFVPITAFTKVSILLTYLRIFPSQTNKRFCYGLLTFTVAWAVLSFCLSLFQCLFNLTGKWPNIRIESADFLIFLWPAKDLAQVQISLKQKITLIAMFCLGVIICIAGVCRIWYTSVFINSYDSLWTGATLYVIVAIETSIGIVCGCLPACRPLMTKLFPHIFTSLEESTHKKTSKVADQPFVFHSLSGGIIKEDAYSVSYHDAHAITTDHRNTSRIKAGDSRNSIEEVGNDAISTEGSVEWIMMKDKNKGASG